MAQMCLRDNRVYTTWGDPLRDDGLVISRHDLTAEIGYINARGIVMLEITTFNPRIIVDRAFYEDRLRQLQTAENTEHATAYLTDIAPLRECPQLVQLTLSGDLLNSEVLTELPNLRCLSLDNTLGKHKVDLSTLSLHTLYIQKPSRNVVGYEQLVSLRELCIWNYHPKSRDLSQLSALNNLQHLRLIQPRIDTLDGVENLPSLQKLGVYHARTLHDDSALLRCHSPIEFSTDPNSTI